MSHEDSELFKAIRNSDAGKVKNLLEGKADPNQMDMGISSLACASVCNNLEIVKLLLDEKANPNLKGQRDSGLHLTTNFYVALTLLRAGADPSKQNHYGDTPAQIALRLGLTSLVELFDAWKRDKNAAAFLTALHGRAGARSVLQKALNTTIGEKQVVRGILKKALGQSVATLEKNQNLLSAVQDRNLDEVRKLLASRADINTRFHENSLHPRGTSLHLAAFQGDAELVNLLLEAKADANAKTTKGMTPLMCAVGRMNANKVNTLLKVLKKEDLDERDSHGHTAFYSACYFNLTDIAKILLQAGADPTIPDNSGKTPRELAVSQRQDIVDLIDNPPALTAAPAQTTWSSRGLASQGIFKLDAKESARSGEAGPSLGLDSDPAPDSTRPFK